MAVAIYGIGSMGGAILDGLLARGHEVIAVARRPEAIAELDARDGVRALPLAEAAASADVHVVAVKPYGVADLLAEAGPHLRAGSMVVCVALGITLDDLAGMLPEGVLAVRAMPSTPARVGEGMTVLSPGPGLEPERLAEIEELLGATGRTIVVPEGQQDVATALSGSAPAYLFLVVEAMIDAGVALGLPRPTARELAVQSVVGAGALMRETGEEPGLLRAQVTSPGGSTAAALAALEEHGVRHAVRAAVQACAERSAGRSLP